MRRIVDDNINQEHRTFTDRKYYCMAIPNRVAIDSGKYDNSDVFYVTVRDNYLKPYIFYSAEMRCGRNATAYPFIYKDSVIITSHIDELALVEKWIELGYPSIISLTGGVEDPDDPTTPDDPSSPTTIQDIPVVQDASDVKNPADGFTVFDIVELDTNNQ